LNADARGLGTEAGELREGCGAAGARGAEPRTREERLLIVVGEDADNFSGGIELHDLRGFAVANIAAVVGDDGFDTPQDIRQCEAKIGIGVEAELEVIAQGGFSLDDAGAVFEQGKGDGGKENDVVIVMREDTVEVVGVPGVGPVLGKGACEGRLNGEGKSFHGLLWIDSERVRAGHSRGGEAASKNSLHQKDFASDTTQAAPATRKVSAISDQLKCASG